MDIDYYKGDDLTRKYRSSDTPEHIKNCLSWLVNDVKIPPKRLFEIMDYYPKSEIVAVIPTTGAYQDYVILVITIDGVGYSCEYGNHGSFIKFTTGKTPGVCVEERLFKYTDLFEENENEN